MKRCSVKECGLKYYSNGFCRKHYSRWYRKGHTNLAIAEHKCTFENCETMTLRSKYCHKHYMLLYQRTDENKKYRLAYKIKHPELYPHKRDYLHKCEAPGCIIITPSAQYCQHHRNYLKKYGNFEPHTTHGNRGVYNHRWNGGVSDYPNHYEFKKNRLVKLEQTNYKCEVCGKRAKHVHHKDLEKTNHSLSNLQSLCIKCHSNIHHPHKKTLEERRAEYQRSIDKRLNKKKFYCVICGEFIPLNRKRRRSQYCYECRKTSYEKRKRIILTAKK